MATVVNEPKDTRMAEIGKGFQDFANSFVQAFDAKQSRELVEKLQDRKHEQAKELMTMGQLHDLNKMAKQYDFDIAKMRESFEQEMEQLNKTFGFKKEYAEHVSELEWQNRLKELRQSFGNEERLMKLRQQYGMEVLGAEQDFAAEQKEADRDLARTEGQLDRESRERIAETRVRGAREVAKINALTNMADKTQEFAAWAMKERDLAKDSPEQEKQIVASYINRMKSALGLDEEFPDIEVSPEGFWEGWFSEKSRFKLKEDNQVPAIPDQADDIIWENVP